MAPFRFLLHAVDDGSVRFLQSYFHLLPVCLWQLSEMGRAPDSAPPAPPPAAPRKPLVRAVPSTQLQSSQSLPPTDPERSREVEAGSALTQEPVQATPSWRAPGLIWTPRWRLSLLFWGNLNLRPFFTQASLETWSACVGSSANCDPQACIGHALVLCVYQALGLGFF